MHSAERRAFTILELAIVVTIIGILAALAIPILSMIVKKSRLSTLASDLRTHAQAIQRYAAETGDYPDTWQSVGVMIPGTDGFVSQTWIEPSAIGGGYTWVLTNPGDPARRAAYVQVVPTGAHPFAVGLADLAKLDADIDDGNVSTGYLQLAGERVRYFVQLPSN